jgi:hypothetical protein
MRVSGRLIGLFSFDIGYEIDLEYARRITQQGEARGIERRRAAPPSLAYTTTPLRLPLGDHDVPLGEATVSAASSAIIHDFGVVTVAFQTPLACDVAALPALTATLAGAGPMEDVARRLLEQLSAQLTPAVRRSGLNDFVEDYYILQVGGIEPAVSISELIARERGHLASALRCEPSPLSEAEVAEVFRTQISYYPDDLAVAEWNVALIVDADYTDAVNVLEYLNIQLLELRFYDAALDRRVAETYETAATPVRALPLMYGASRRAIEDLAAIRLDVATVFERVHNALKLSGDLYLAKLYSRAGERLGLRTWEESVDRKLNVLQKRYDVLVQRVTTARAEALELTIIILIAVEIILFLLIK